MQSTARGPAFQCAVALFLGLAASQLGAQPTGGQVVAGSAAITAGAGAFTVTQTSARAIINWQDFSIATGDFARFIQPDATSATLNRVISGLPSSLDGTLQANGRVYLINPNGILVGASARIDTGGFLASTLDVANQEFLAGGDLHFTGGSTAAIKNLGAVNALGGDVFLIARQVENAGAIAAANGTAGLAAGSEVLLTTGGNERLFVLAASVAGSVVNSGTITAATAELKAAGGNAYALAINNSGLVRATGTALRNGQVWLVAGNDGTVVNSGTLAAAGGEISVSGKNVLQAGLIDASGASGGTIALSAKGRILQTAGAALRADGAQGAGGKLTVDASPDGSLYLSGRLSARGTNGGRILVQGREVQLAAALVDATGVTAGGRIFIGGGIQGARLGGSPNAQTVNVGPGSVLDVSASGRGPAGAAVVWSEVLTNFGGAALARGGPQGGDGGLLEVSSRGTVGFGGRVDAGADAGRRGLFLLDPKNLTIEASAPSSGPGIFTLPDPTPAAGDHHGSSDVVELATGNIVVASPGDNFAASQAGAVYLYDGTTRALISLLTGSTANDAVGSYGITRVGNGNYVATSGDWNNGGTAAIAGAVTWGSGLTGVSGAVSAANSLVGTTTDDQVGANLYALTNGNYVVLSYAWNNGAATKAGAVTLGSGATGITGAVSAVNSLVGSTADDTVGSGLAVLTNGNYVVNSNQWANGAAAQAGAVTWGNGVTGVTGAVSAANSLVGSTAGDHVGGNPAIALPNGNYVVTSGEWNNGGAAASAGAVTWGNGTTGVSGILSAANSLVGSTTNDGVGAVVLVLANGNYVVNSNQWTNGAAARAGAVTWGSGATGVSGVVSAANSLVGTTANDAVGAFGVAGLAGGNYIVSSPNWHNGAMADAGASTWADGLTGLSGAVSAGNSLVGSTAMDQVALRLFGLTNGNYVVGSPNWSNGATGGAGAATWVSGTTGLTGVVSATNSLVGTTAGDQVGNNLTPLTNGNYVAQTQQWWNGAVVNAGAATWGSGTAGISGAVSATNSLVGTTAGDMVGYQVYRLTGGSYVVASPTWSNGAVANAGAATWGSGTTGVSGAVTAANSLVGTSPNDAVGGPNILALTNGNFVVLSQDWNLAAGAATWGSGTTGVSGAVSAANSLIGSAAGDRVGYNYLGLANGNYVVISPNWANGVAANAGAVTWGSGATGITGAVSAANSLVGTTALDAVGLGGVRELTDGNYVVSSLDWANGAAAAAGAATWASGTTGISGAVTATNSLVGSTANDQVGYAEPLANGTYVVTSSYWNNGAATAAGAVTWSTGATGITGVVSAANSLVGLTADDTAGSEGILELSNGNLVVMSPDWDNGAVDAGIVHYLTPGASAANPSAQTYAASPGADTILSAAQVTGILDTGTDLVLQANNDLTVNAAITANNAAGNGGALTLSAGRSVLLNANITTDHGNLTVIANDLLANGVVDAHRDAGAAVITMAGGTTINAGTGAVTIDLRTGTGLTQSTSGALTLGSITAGSISATNRGPSAGNVVILPGATLAAADAGDALTLAAASGGNFVNNSGAGALSTPAGRWLVYSTSPAGSTENGLTAAAGSTSPRLYNRTFAGNAPATIAAGHHLIYSAQPALTVTAGSQTRLYGDANAAFTATLTGLLSDDGVTDTLTSAAVTGAAGLTSPATATSAVADSPFAITAAAGSLASGAGYTFNFTPGVLTITARPVTVTADSGLTKVYGGVDPVSFTFTTTSLGGGGPLGGALTRTAGETVAGGAYAITQGTVTDANNPNYLLTYTGSSFAISPATLTYTANAASRLAGASDPAFSGTISGFVGGEVQGTATTGTMIFTTTATGASVAGLYPLNGSGLTANSGNYLFVQAAGNATAFTISTLPPVTPLTITADDKTKLYGAALPAFTATFAGFINGDTAANVTGLQFSTTAAMGSNVGTFAITPFGATAPAAYLVGYVPGTLTINPAALTIMADDKSRAFAAANPAFTASFAGFVNGDTPAVVTGLQLTTPATVSSPVGSYAITAAGATAANYVLTYLPGTLLVGRNLLTITADPKAKTYGAALPAFTASFAGLVNGDTSAVVTGLQFSTTATMGSNIGTFTLTPFGAAAANYSLAYVSGLLTISPAALTLTAADAEREFDAPNPAFTGTFTGFVNGDTAAVVSGSTFSTPATPASAAGNYAITPRGATATNYTLAFVDGTLRVVTPSVIIGTTPQPVVTVGQIPALTPEFAVVELGDRLVLVPVGSPGDPVASVDERLSVTLGEATGLAGFESATPVPPGVTTANTANLGRFELAASPGGSSPSPLGEPGLFRESSVNMGGFNIIYHEALAAAREQSANNTALGSSYREFSDSDNPQVNIVRVKRERKPAEPAAGRNPAGAP